jgi:negative regulator of flagellin synthesis FlgM
MKLGSPADKPAAVSTPATPSTTAPAATSGAPNPAAPVVPATEPSAKVALSDAAAKLLVQDAAPSSDFDAEKVARVSVAIDSGSFKVDAGAIADKLIANATEVLKNNQTPKP